MSSDFDPRRPGGRTPDPRRARAARAGSDAARRQAARGAEQRRRQRALALFVVCAVLLGGAIVGLLIAGNGDDGQVRGTTAAHAAATTGHVIRPAAGAAHGSGGAAATNAAGPGDGEPGSATDPRSPASWPLSGDSARRKHVPILMYHLIDPAPAGTAYPGLWVPPELLAQHVAALAKAGFTGVTLGEVWDAWHGHGRLPKSPVVLSFDDGDISQVLGAGPVLEQAGWPGVLNLAVSHLGKGGIPTWGAKRLIRQGWEIDSHTIDHLDVTTLDAAALSHQLSGSKVAIKHRLGVNPRFFCYPAGRNDTASQVAVRAAGYLAATTTAPGLAQASGDPFTLPRIRVQPSTSPATLVAQARGTVSGPAGETGE